MQPKLTLALVVAAWTAMTLPSTAQTSIPDLGLVRNAGGLPAYLYWTAKAQCWRDLATAEAAQGDTHGTAQTAASNAAAIVAGLNSGAAPQESPIFSKRYLPSSDPRHGRPQWLADIVRIDAALERYRAARCLTPVLGCLEVAQQSVYENLEETRGARWNHGRPEIDKALALADEAEKNFDTACAVPPNPIPLPPPPAPMAKEVTLSADVLFVFDSAVLSAEGIKVVDELADAMRKEGIGAVSVTGHADRFGTAAYNQALSSRRAAAVAAQLRTRLPSVQAASFARGSTEPIVTCSGVKTPETVACLAPNRRVVVKTGR